MNIIERLLNWFKRPASVFYFAIPLFAIGISLLGLRAFLEIKLHGDFVYAGILAFGFALLTLALWPIRKPLARILFGK